MAATERRLACALLLAAGALPWPGFAAVLPEERADALYHHFEGGGMEISGPSVLVRKNFREKVSVSANYYADNVSSASIDVLTTASPYTEEREETKLGVDLLSEKTMLGVAWINSEESDYSASTLAFSFAQDFFGDLSNLSLGYAAGRDEVRRNGDPAFAEGIDRHSFRIGYSQVLTRRALLGLTHEVIADEGYLNNPYRSVRFLDPTSPRGYAWQPEVYPGTRTSSATALRLAWHLPWRDAVRTELRYYTDTWGISAHNIELAYSRELAPRWRADARIRAYSQGKADFYSDLFPYRDAQNFLARDKELSTFDTLLFGGGIAYIIKAPETSRWNQLSFNLQLDWIDFDYADFRDARASVAPGSEPLYGYDALVTRLFFSFWY